MLAKHETHHMTDPTLLTAEPVRNIAQTLADVLPQAEILHVSAAGDVLQIAVPKTCKLRTVDLESLGVAPRRMAGAATFSTAESWLAYVARHATAHTVAWCDFNPQTFALAFTATLDDHAPGVPGWRAHTARFRPDMSAEWKAWKSQDRQALTQLAFAEWLQEHEDDINSSAAGLPTSLQMHQMATEFVANEERTLKSTVRLQSGGVRLTYIADPDSGTTETMQMFERFAIGIPVFHGGSAWSITARLKYSLERGAVRFRFELVRPDRVHQGAAEELISQIRSGLGSVPLLMGSAS